VPNQEPPIATNQIIEIRLVFSVQAAATQENPVTLIPVAGIEQVDGGLQPVLPLGYARRVVEDGCRTRGNMPARSHGIENRGGVGSRVIKSVVPVGRWLAVLGDERACEEYRAKQENRLPHVGPLCLEQVDG